MIPFPNKKYNIIYADPPWSYDDKGCEGSVKDYQTMTLQDIENLPVEYLKDNPCVLFLWVTFPLLQEGLKIMNRWGFEYSTLGFSWIKLNQNGSPFFGIGHYTKSNCEVCLIGGIGHIHQLIKSDAISSVVMTKKTKHSEKPHEVRNRIDQLVVNDIPKIELFARHKIKGWDQWGNQVPEISISDYI